MLLQGFALRHVPAGRAALFLLLEPVFAVALGSLVAGTPPGLREVGGGALVLLALLVGQGVFTSEKSPALNHGRSGDRAT